MNIQGKLIEKFETQVVSDKFKKREFVLEISENPQYPQLVKFEFVQDKCTLLDSINVGASVSVDFNLNGRSWVNQQGLKQYFNTLQAWKIAVVGNAQAQPQEATPTQEGDDLPF